MTYIKNAKRLIDFGVNNQLTIEAAAEILKTDLYNIDCMLKQMESDGYILKSRIPGIWTPTIGGKLLLIRKENRKYKVESINRQLKKLVYRIKQINASEEYHLFIPVAKITSTYPIVQPQSGVEIKYALIRKSYITPNECTSMIFDLNKKRNNTANNIIDYLFYPNLKIKLFLKSRSHILKLQEASIEEVQSIKGYTLYATNE